MLPLVINACDAPSVMSVMSMLYCITLKPIEVISDKIDSTHGTLHRFEIYSRTAHMTVTVVDGISGRKRMSPFLNRVDTKSNELISYAHAHTAVLVN